MVRTPPGLVPGDGGGGWSGDFGACVWDDGSNDDPDDPDTGTAAGCAAQGGTFDSQLGNSDYNPNPNQELEDFVDEIQNSQVVTVNGAPSNPGAPLTGTPDQCAALQAAADNSYQNASATAPTARATIGWMAGGAVAGASGGWVGAGLGALGGFIGEWFAPLSHSWQQGQAQALANTCTTGIPAFTL